MADAGVFDTFFEVVRALEKERGTKIWSMVHCGHGHICYPALMNLLRTRHLVGSGETVEILLHSGGGHPEVAYQVMKFFRRRFKKVNVIVPLYAKSAGTLMCLGADKVIVGEMADLGPIDIQLNDDVEHGERGFSPLDEFKSMEFMRDQSVEWMAYYATIMNHQFGMSIKEALKDSIPLVTGLMRPLFEQIDPIEMGGYRRNIAIGEEYARRLLSDTNNANAAKIIRRAVWDYPAHGFCINFEEAKDLGLPIERLPADQDLALTAALLSVSKDQYHGFIPAATAQPAAATTTAAAKTGRVRKTKRASGVGNARHVNGSGGASTGSGR